MKNPNGSSPRLRGTALEASDRRIGIRFIPAPAGNRFPSPLASRFRPVHPRACGEQIHPRATR